jgi:hypothetical protein
MVIVKSFFYRKVIILKTKISKITEVKKHISMRMVDHYVVHLPHKGADMYSIKYLKYLNRSDIFKEFSYKVRKYNKM